MRAWHMYGENFHFIFIHKTKAPLSEIPLCYSPPPPRRWLCLFAFGIYTDEADAEAVFVSAR